MAAVTTMFVSMRVFLTPFATGTDREYTHTHTHTPRQRPMATIHHQLLFRFFSHLHTRCNGGVETGWLKSSTRYNAGQLWGFCFCLPTHTTPSRTRRSDETHTKILHARRLFSGTGNAHTYQHNPTDSPALLTAHSNGGVYTLAFMAALNRTGSSKAILF